MKERLGLSSQLNVIKKNINTLLSRPLNTANATRLLALIRAQNHLMNASNKSMILANKLKSVRRAR